ncbi:MAG: hypothetical protein IMZ44_15920, partial [Planctomycetes bacterium]|nr:hypothetical protein [Planctomycetota bacterium]
DGDTIHPRHLNLLLHQVPAQAPDVDRWAHIDLTGPLADISRRVLDEVERLAITRALAAADGHRGRAAEMLGIGFATLTAKIRQHHIDAASTSGSAV